MAGGTSSTMRRDRNCQFLASPLMDLVAFKQGACEISSSLAQDIDTHLKAKGHGELFNPTC